MSDFKIGDEVRIKSIKGIDKVLNKKYPKIKEMYDQLGIYRFAGKKCKIIEIEKKDWQFLFSNDDNYTVSGIDFRDRISCIKEFFVEPLKSKLETLLSNEKIEND